MIRKNLNTGWEFKKLTDKNWLPATVPGTIHTDLLDKKIIAEPFYRDEETKLQWIGNETWMYRLTFDVENEILQKENIILNFEGLDTYAEISLNGQTILNSDNMFCTWKVDAKPLLKEKVNVLEITFLPSAMQDSLKAAQLTYKLPDNRVFSRKAAYQSGWDWGPKFVTCGIWRPVSIQAWDDLLIQNIYISTDSLIDGKATMKLEANIISGKDGHAAFRFYVNDKKTVCTKISLVKGTNNLSFDFEIENPELWWSNGLGEPHLYQAELRINNSDGFLAIKNNSFGIRKIELIQEPDTTGRSFYIKLNGRPVFMKGANYIPSESFTTRTTPEKYKALILSAKAANMNMLRVWGGGIYENDIFYDFCDENGILVWQDFMFACNLYPGGEDFFENVQKEAEDNIIRLRNHPCIALWCGNNEVDEAWHNWGWQKQLGYSEKDSIEIWNNYLKVFADIIPETLQKLDPARPYHPSSPSIGWGRKESLLSGDSHYWGVWWGGQPFEIYTEKVGRFMSEYGFQGMPSMNSIKKFTLTEDRKIGSPVMQVHQKHPRGTELINLYMERDYKIPSDFENYIYVSQLLQAEGMITAIEAHRRAMPRCMGTLYWQFNDCWPVTSWSSVDYYGNWKALHYFSKDAFSQTLVSPTLENTNLKVYVITDDAKGFDAILKLKLMDFDGKNIWEKDTNVFINGNKSNLCFEMPAADLLNNNDKRKIVLVAEVMAQNRAITKNLLYFEKPKNLILPAVDPEIQVEKNDRGYRILVSTQVFIKNLYLEFPGIDGHFDRNFLDILPGEKVEIIFETKSEIPNQNLKPVFRSLNRINNSLTAK
jgi:beta-mannosidase